MIPDFETQLEILAEAAAAIPPNRRHVPIQNIGQSYNEIIQNVLNTLDYQISQCHEQLNESTLSKSGRRRLNQRIRKYSERKQRCLQLL